MVKFKKTQNKTQDKELANFDSDELKLSYSLIRREKIKIRKNNPDVFHFNIDSSFIYESIHCDFYYNKLNKNNTMKPTKEEISEFYKLLRNQINNQDLNDVQKFVIIPKNIYDYFKNMNPINQYTDFRINQIKNLISGLGGSKISCRKLEKLYTEKYGYSISKNTINQILRNKLNMHFLKTNPKNAILLSNNSVKKTFFVLKVLIRHIKLGGNIIYVDESSFSTVNNNYKTWRQQNSQIFNQINDNQKINLILAVSSERVIHWKILNQNTTSAIFKCFFLEMINKMEKSELKKSLFFLDNATIHSTLEMMKFYSDNKLKILFNVPYLSFFNMVELAFRSLKSILYDSLFTSIKEVEKKLISLIEGEKLKFQLRLLFKETIQQYIKFINDNIDCNIN